MTTFRRATLPALALGFLLAASAWGQHQHHAMGTKVDYDPEPGGGDPRAPANCQGVLAKVIVRDSSFSVPVITVNPGQPVCWTWAGTIDMHNVKADNGAFTSGMPDTKGNFQVTLTTPGTYGYFCQVHGNLTDGMRGTVIVRDNDGGGGDSGPGRLGLTSPYTVDEGAGVVTISVEREGGSDGAASVSFATAPGTAKPGKDFLTRKGTLSWAAGDGTPKTFDVTIKNDSAPESDKSFSVKLSKPKGAPLGTSTATVIIHDDDNPGCGPALTAPSQLLARGQSASEIRLTWDDVSSAASALKVERRQQGGAFQEIASLSAGATSFTDSGLPADATFLYRVKAEGLDGSTAVSEIAAAATDGPATPCGEKRAALCLANGRFEATVEWRGTSPAAVGESKRLTLPEAPNSGLFSPSADPDQQLLLTVVDGCALNDHYGLNLATVADDEFTVKVRDTATGHAWVYFNPAGNVPAPVRDVDALACR